MRLVSPEFLLPVVLAAAIHRALPRRLRWLWLGLTGAAFYLAFAGAWLGLLAALILLNYLIAARMANLAPERRRGWLAAGLLLNMGGLAFFKLGPLSAPAIEAAARFLGLNGRGTIGALALPLGLSFFVFTASGYLIEVRPRVPSSARGSFCPRCAPAGPPPRPTCPRA